MKKSYIFVTIGVFIALVIFNINPIIHGLSTWMSEERLSNGYYLHRTEDHTSFFMGNDGIYGPDIVWYEVDGDYIYMLVKVIDKKIDGKMVRKFSGHECEYIWHNMKDHSHFKTNELSIFSDNTSKKMDKGFAATVDRECTF